jgi:hypothetical protein
VPIPEGAGGKKSYSLKPIQGSRPGAASLGILSLDVIIHETIHDEKILYIYIYVYDHIYTYTIIVV